MMRDLYSATATTIEAILRSSHGRRYRHAGPSPWPAGHGNRLGKSMEEAANDGRNTANLLLRWTDSSGTLAGLAAHLRKCTSNEPCASGACPSCCLAAQRLTVEATHHFLGGSDAALSLVTVMATGDSARTGELGDRPLHAHLRPRLHRALHAAGCRAIGGLELSLNVAENAWHHPRWIEHAHLVVPRRHAEILGEHLREAFPATRGIRRPVRIDTFDGSLRGIAYALKNRALLRVELDPARRPRGDGPRHSTRWKPLRQGERIELAMAQHHAGLSASFFLHGLRLVVEDDHPRIRRLHG